MTHAESIELFRSLGAKFTPELKSPSVEQATALLCGFRWANAPTHRDLKV